MQLQGKRIAMLAENLYEDLELWYPALQFRLSLRRSATMLAQSKHASLWEYGERT